MHSRVVVADWLAFLVFAQVLFKGLQLVHGVVLRIIALGLLYDMEAFFSRHTRLFSSFDLPGKSHAVLAVFFDYGIPPHGVAWRGFHVVHRVERRDAVNTAKPRRNCSGEALLLTT